MTNSPTARFFVQCICTALLFCNIGKSQEQNHVGAIRTGFFVELGGGGTGVAGDIKAQSGPYFTGKVGYTISSLASFDLKFVSGKTLLYSTTLYPVTISQPRIGTVAFESALRFLKGSPVYPLAFIGYNYSTLLADTGPVYDGHGYQIGIGMAYHFSTYFSLNADAYFGRTWYHTRNGGAGANGEKFTDDRLGGEVTVGFWPGIVP